MADRSFTPSEANSALDQVRPLAERMVEVRARLTELEDEQREVVQIVAGNGSSEAVGEARTPEFARLAAELQRCFDALAEPAVAWWHGVEDGFAGRRPIDWGDE